MGKEYVYQKLKNQDILVAFIDEKVCPDTVHIEDKEYKFVKNLHMKETGYGCKGYYKDNHALDSDREKTGWSA